MKIDKINKTIYENFEKYTIKKIETKNGDFFMVNINNDNKQSNYITIIVPFKSNKENIDTITIKSNSEDDLDKYAKSFINEINDNNVEVYSLT